MLLDRFAVTTAALYCALSLTVCSAGLRVSAGEAPLASSLPTEHPLLLENQLRVGPCRPDTEGETSSGDCGAHRVDWVRHVAILNAATGQATTWDFCRLGHLPADAAASADCGDNGEMLFWAKGAEKMLYQRAGRLYLLSPQGYQTLHLHMPGQLRPYAGMRQYCLSADARYIVYTLCTRDRSDTSVDPAGRLYEDLMVQSVSGTPPQIVASGHSDYSPALSPDGRWIAYTDGTALKIATLAGRVINTIPLPVQNRRDINWVQAIRWAPNGKELAALIKFQLYVASPRATHFTRAAANPHIASVMSLAWSPNSRQIAFRSAYEGEKRCSYGPQLSAGTIVLRLCAPGYRLYAVTVADGRVRRLQAATIYHPGALFWIQ